jgi:hypothetical protein
VDLGAFFLTGFQLKSQTVTTFPMKREADEDDSKALSEALANVEEKLKQVREEGKRPDQEAAFISPNSESER